MIWSRPPANTPWAKAKQQSWDASEPATVYTTPEVLADGTPCSAVTVILRAKVATGGGLQVARFAVTSTIHVTT